MPSAPRPVSSNVIGTVSGPGSATIPLMTVPATPVVLTVVKLMVRSDPDAAFVFAASRNAPSAAARIAVPTTCSVMTELPGNAPWNNRYAKLPSCAGATTDGTTLPDASVA